MSSTQPHEYTEEQKALIDKYRDINVDHSEWALPTIWDCVDRLEEKGIEVSPRDVLFSGFWSQGDGASFEGIVRHNQVKHFMEVHNLADLYPGHYYMAQKEDFHIDIQRRHSMYYHENTVAANVDFYGDGYSDADPNDVRMAIYMAMHEEMNSEAEDFDEEINKILRGYMKQLYRDLEKAYDSETSDEAVWSTIVANELDQPN